MSSLSTLNHAVQWARDLGVYTKPKWDLLALSAAGYRAHVTDKTDYSNGK